MSVIWSSGVSVIQGYFYVLKSMEKQSGLSGIISAVEGSPLSAVPLYTMNFCLVNGPR